MSASALAAINIWTGAPLLAVWAGSRVARGSALSMSAVLVVVVVLVTSCLALAAALTWLSARYDALTGRPPEARRTSPWLRSMRGEREELARKRHGISAIERIVVVAVVVCVLVFEVWFFFFAGSSLPSQ
jgi:flagellar basal body-associated protein FliL